MSGEAEMREVIASVKTGEAGKIRPYTLPQSVCLCQGMPTTEAVYTLGCFSCGRPIPVRTEWDKYARKTKVSSENFEDDSLLEKLKEMRDRVKFKPPKDGGHVIPDMIMLGIEVD